MERRTDAHIVAIEIRLSTFSFSAQDGKESSDAKIKQIKENMRQSILENQQTYMVVKTLSKTIMERKGKDERARD